MAKHFWRLEAEVEFDRKSVLTIGACLMKKENADSNDNNNGGKSVARSLSSVPSFYEVNTDMT